MSSSRTEWRRYFAFWPVAITHGDDGLFLTPREAIKMPVAWLQWVEKREQGALFLPGPVYRFPPKPKEQP